MGRCPEPIGQQESAMSTFQLSLVSPESLLFSGQVDQVDLPGVEGDFGVLSGHAPIVAMLRPGIVTAMAGNVIEKFVVFGGLAEFSNEQLTILADSASSVEDFDLAALKSKIEELQQGLEKQPAGGELDRAIAMLDHYKSIHTTLAPATAF
jgi:F-type H+-transporting ATPase subunit epsilon